MHFVLFQLRILQVTFISLISAKRDLPVVRTKPHRMMSGRELCWLNSSVQLILSNDELVNSLLKDSSVRPISHQSGTAELASVADYNDENVLLDFSTKIDQCNDKYLLDVLQSSIDKSLPARRVQSYVDDLRKYGPKIYIKETNEYVPVIHPFGEISCANEYLSSILLPSIQNHGDVSVVYNQTIVCSHCKAESIVITEHHSLLPLKMDNCTDTKFPEAALHGYFLSMDNAEPKTCPTCSTKSSSNLYRRHIVQLPDTLFLFICPDGYVQNSDHQVNARKFYIQEKLSMTDFASKQLICYPSYFNYELKSFIITSGDRETNRHYRTLAKYGTQFYRCDDNTIECVDRSSVFETEHFISIAMYTRCKTDHVNFVDMISSMINETNISSSTTSINNTHVRLMFDAALEHLARGTCTLSWNHGFTFTCLACKQGNIEENEQPFSIFHAVFSIIENFIFGKDCVLFSWQRHVSKNIEIPLDDILVQARIVPKVQCSNRCDGDTFIKDQRYSIFRAPKFVFVTLETTSAGAMNQQMQQRMYIKSGLIEKSFSYRLNCFIIITKDERTFIIQPKPNNTYVAFNHVTKVYEPLFGYHFDDFIAAAAGDMVLCYETDDDIELLPKMAMSSLDLNSWTDRADPDSDVLEYALHEQISHIVEPIEIGQYKIKTSDITQILSTSHELNDEQLNAHLQVTSTLADGILLVDSIQSSKYVTRGFDKLSEVLQKQWFKHNVVLVPIHHAHHWTLFIIDIKKKTILFFDSLQSMNHSYEHYHRAILQLLRTHSFYTHKRRIDLTQWRTITDFSAWQQQDVTSCGVHCAMFARSYVTETRRPPITIHNVETNRKLFCMHLITGT